MKTRSRMGLKLGLTLACGLAWVGAGRAVSAPAAALVYPDWKSSVPEPVFEANPGYVKLYWQAWQYAAEHVNTGQNLPQSPYMDEGFWGGVIWVWDTCFMAQYSKYAPDQFPGVQSLNNFYVPFLEGGDIGQGIEHPDNPPLMAWCEFVNWTFSGMTSQGRGVEAAQKTLGLLTRYFEWWGHMPLEARFGRDCVHLRRVEDVQGHLEGFYWNGNASGMDNTPRGRGIGWDGKLKCKPMLWVDALAEHALSAREVVQMAEQLGDQTTAKEFQQKYDALKTLLNTKYWDDKDGCYYDISAAPKTSGDRFSRVLTPASFWPLLAGVASREQAARMVQLVTNNRKLGGPVPFPSLARDDPNFDRSGQYWKGAVWMPLSYMGIKAIQQYGYDELADAAAEATVNWMLQTYENPAAIAENGGRPTIWECYNSTEPMPGTHGVKYSRPDFCGWSALGPVSLFIENILGFHRVDYPHRAIDWRLHHPGVQGIRKLTFGDITTSILYDGKDSVTVESTAPYTLIINGVKHHVPVGTTTVSEVRSLPAVFFQTLCKEVEPEGTD